MVTMDRIDQMMKEAQETQGLDLEDLQPAEGFPITGVQLNKASRPVTIFQRETGEPRTLPAIAAKIALQKRYRKRDNPLFGQYIFSAKPTKQYHKGEVKCLLHPDNPQRKQFDAWGLPICTAAHLAAPGEAQKHMELRHKSAYAIIQRDQNEQKRQEQIDVQTALAKAVLQAVQQRPGADAPLYVSDKPKK